ncbi:MAG: PTS sugar transporter subunit IIC [Clostridiaceae bacterium]|nr:PTS sugar transporter subunit IIC [Clostridiaceae bacterium]
MAKEKEGNTLSRLLRRYFVDAMGAMAYGLFASLIVGTILGQLSGIPGLAFLSDIAATLKNAAVYGAAIGVAIAWGLKADAMVIFSCAGAGAIGGTAGGAVGAMLAAIIGAELGQLVSKKTPVDIVVTPLVTVVTGGLVGVWAGPHINAGMLWLGDVINKTTQLAPLPMGMAVGAIVGMILTLPISSAALCVMMGLSGLAGGAATAGCCAQMIGFAVISFKENGVSGLVSQGIGTSMLQVPNIMKRPAIWIAPTVASAAVGALSATVFRMVNVPVGAGMGTSGLVGQITTFGTMAPEYGTLPTLTAILLVHFLIPALVALAVDRLMRKIGWVRAGDMKLQKI